MSIETELMIKTPNEISTFLKEIEVTDNDLKKKNQTKTKQLYIGK